MTVTIYAYRTLLWTNQQNRDDIPASIIPEEVLPAEERAAAHDEMDRLGWLAETDEAVAGGPDFALSSSGKQRGRRWAEDYALHSAAYEIIQAIPTGPGADLQAAELAFGESYQDPLTGERPSVELIDQAGGVLYRDRLVDGEMSHGFVSPARLEMTEQGRHVRREHYVPGVGAPNSGSTLGASVMNQFNTNISGGTFGAAQFGKTNHATVNDVRSELNQQFQTVRELANSEVSAQDRQEVLEQIGQLEAAAQQGSETFRTLLDKFLSESASKLGERTVSALTAIPALIAQLGG